VHRVALTLFVLLAILGIVPVADAGQGSIESHGNCTISATGVSFGSYNVFSTLPTDSTGTITYRCSGNAIVAIGITRGVSSTFNSRAMTRGAEQLAYNLYLDAARTSIWGDTTGGSQIYVNATVPHNTNVPLTIYGRIPGGQDVAAGTYTDHVIAIVLF
jgi:spore coat protein U-like protein